MTSGRAAVLKIISIYREMQYALSKIEVQKLVYFLEEAGEPLRLEFTKSKYGPYSDKLRHVLKRMDGHYLRGVGDHAGEAEIVLVPSALEAAEKFLNSSGETAVRERVSQVGQLIEGFETPYGMELIATVHWIATREPHAQTGREAVIAVHSWNERKRQILREPHILAAWRRLEGAGWLNRVSPP